MLILIVLFSFSIAFLRPIRLLPKDHQDLVSFHVCLNDNASFQFVYATGLRSLGVLIFGCILFVNIIFTIWFGFSWFKIELLKTCLKKLDLDPPIVPMIKEIPAKMYEKSSTMGGFVFLVILLLFAFSTFYDVGYTYQSRYVRNEIPLTNKYDHGFPDTLFWMFLEHCDGVSVDCTLIESLSATGLAVLERSAGQVLFQVPNEGINISLGQKNGILKYGISNKIREYRLPKSPLCLNRTGSMQPYELVSLLDLKESYYFQNFERSFYCSDFDLEPKTHNINIDIEHHPIYFCTNPQYLSSCPPYDFSYGSFEILLDAKYEESTTVETFVRIQQTVIPPRRPTCFVDTDQQTTFTLAFDALRNMGSFIGLYTLARFVAKSLVSLVRKLHHKINSLLNNHHETNSF